MWPMMGYGYGGGWTMIAGGLVWIVIGAVAVVLLYRLLQPAAGRPGGGGASALDLLQERYVRGEIERDEYLQKRKDLLGRA